MSSTERQRRVGAFNNSSEDRGPSYWDCRSLTTEIEQEFPVHVQFTLGPHNASERYRGPAWWVRAIAVPREGRYRELAVGAAPFGGNSGTATMPSAIFAAIHALWDKLEEGIQQELNLDA